jgi:hypothetical protein
MGWRTSKGKQKKKKKKEMPAAVAAAALRHSYSVTNNQHSQQ